MKADQGKDLYGVLGVSPMATPEEVKRAHRALVRRFHPDSGAEAASPAEFQQVQEAYQVLSDPLRRRAYDRLRTERGEGEQAALGWNVLVSQTQLSTTVDEQMLYLLVEVRSAGATTDQRLPLNLCLVVDCSTSMQGQRLDCVKTAAHQVIDDMGDQDSLGIVSFSDRAEVLMPSHLMSDRPRAHARISSIWASGGTEILQGLRAGLEQVRQAHRKSIVSHLILLTDGRTYGDEDKCISEARRAGLEGIGISALGIGEDWNDIFVDELVRQAGGTSAYISYPQQIHPTLREIVRKLVVLSARDVQLAVRCNDRARLEAAFRTSPRIEYLVPQEGTLDLGALQPESPTRVLLEVVVGGAPAGRRRLLQLELTADVPALERRERLMFDLEAEFSDAPASEPVPTAIVNTLGRLSIFRMQEQAWKALDDGKQAEARQRLETVATRLLDIGEQDLANLALLEAGRVGQGGEASKKAQKTIRYGTRSLGLNR